ncbi:MAG: toxin TumE [Anaerolineae bacterium]
MASGGGSFCPMIYRYLSRLYDTIHSRGDVEIETLEIRQISGKSGRSGGQLRFYDGSLLVFDEKAQEVRGEIEKVEYRYHYQRADGTLIFRYDSAAHHPELSTFPHHKHIGDRVEPAAPPDLSDVLREIDAILYPSS